MTILIIYLLLDVYLLFPEYIQKVHNLSTKYPSPCAMWIGPIFVVIISKHEDVRAVIRNQACFPKSSFYSPFQNYIESSLFITNDGKIVFYLNLIIPAKINQITLLEHLYKKHKRIVLRTLNPSMGDSVIARFEKHSLQFCENVPIGELIEIKKSMLYLFTRIFCGMFIK